MAHSEHLAFIGLPRSASVNLTALWSPQRCS